jgi:glycosyltransferase involved in cell wall biosynthesis
VSNASSSQVADEGGISVSVIIAVYNAAETVAETLSSLRPQTHTRWQAIVVDDASSDDTVACVQRLAVDDSRIRLVTQKRMGVSAARNKGIGVSHYDWLLFPDGDDWLAPLHLERMSRSVSARPNLDAVHCGWMRVAPDGTRMEETYGPDAEDLFPVFARRCAFSVHACMVCRSIVEDVRGFDSSLQMCEDWDLWQRIARAGACFGALREVLEVVQHLIGACGYLFALSCRHGFSSFDDSLLALPRIEVGGLDRFQAFVAKLNTERTFTVQCEQAVVRG